MRYLDTERTPHPTRDWALCPCYSLKGTPANHHPLLRHGPGCLRSYLAFGTHGHRVERRGQGAVWGARLDGTRQQVLSSSSRRHGAWSWVVVVLLEVIVQLLLLLLVLSLIWHLL